MAVLIPKSTSGTPLLFFMVQSSDHISALTGASPTVKIGKNGASGGAPSGAVSEIDSTNLPGWYQVAGNSTDTNTSGPIALHATAASGDPCDMIVAQVIDTTVNMIGANAIQWAGGTIPSPNVTGVPLVDLKYTLGTLSPAAAGAVSIDWAQVANKTSTVALTGTTVGTATTVTNQLTAAQIATGVWQDTTAGDFTAASSIGKSVMNGVSLGTGLTINGYTGNTPQTGDAYARLGAPAGASVSADVAAVKSDTGTTLTDAAAIKTQTDKLTFTVSNVVDANVLRINGNAAAAANVEHTNQALCRGTVGSSSTTTSVITSAIASPSSLGASGQMIGRVMLFDADTTTANLQGQATNITANTTGSTPTFTVTALTTAPVSGDTFTIV